MLHNNHVRSPKQFDLIGNVFDLGYSGNEVHHTIFLILLVKNMLCSKLHCQKGLDLFFLHSRSERSAVGRWTRLTWYRVISYEKGIKSKLSGNEVYNTACCLLVILRNSCSKLHCQTGFNLEAFSNKVGTLR